MISKNSVLLSLMAVAFCVAPAEAQEFSAGSFAGSPHGIAALNDQSMMQTSSPNGSVAVGKLPKDYLRSAPPQTTEKEAAASNTTANIMVITGLATMLCIGMTITGISIMRHRPHSARAKILVNPKLNGAPF